MPKTILFDTVEIYRAEDGYVYLGAMFAAILTEQVSVGWKVLSSGFRPDDAHNNHDSDFNSTTCGASQVWWAALCGEFAPGKAPIERGFGQPCTHPDNCTFCSWCCFGFTPEEDRALVERVGGDF